MYNMYEKDNHIGRISLIFLLLLILTLFARIIIIQNLGQKSNKSYSDPIISSALIRGTIYDRNGNILALQAPNYGFTVHIELSDPSYIASILDPDLSKDAIAIERDLKNGVTFFPISYTPDPEEEKHLYRLIDNLGLKNEITLTLKETRKYPSESSTRMIVGSVDEDLNGVSGIEKLYDNKLRAIPKLGIKAVRGDDIILTLDASLQIALNNLPLLDAFKESTIALLSDKGEILAYHGEINDELLKALVHSISRNGNITTFTIQPYFPEEKLINAYGYKLYIKANEENVENILLSGVEQILQNQSITADS